MKTALYEASLATAEDDADLRRLLRECVQEGSVRLRFEREPNFFAPAPAATAQDTVIVRQRLSGDVVACGTRTDRLLWLGGQQQLVTYLGDLRVHPAHRKLTGRVLQVGFAEFERVQTTKPTAATFTAIFEDNRAARSALTASRLGLPGYHPAGTLLTSAFFLRKRVATSSQVEVDLAEAADFLNQQRQSRDLAPVMTPEMLSELRCLRVIRDQRRIIGVAGLTDQRETRQIHLLGYSGTLKWVQRPIRLLLSVLGYHAIPKPQQRMEEVFVSHFAADDPQIGARLLKELRTAATEIGAQVLLITQHESDPLAVVQRSSLAVRSRGGLYQVAWPNQRVLSAFHRPSIEGAWL